MPNEKKDSKNDQKLDQEKQIKLLKSQLSEALSKVSESESELRTYKKQILQLNQKVESVINMVAKELEYAKALHKTLMPTERPQIPGFEFSTKFMYGTQTGGDYFDLFEMKAKLKFGILLVSCPSFTLSSLVISIVMKLTATHHKLEHASAQDFIQDLKNEIQQQAPDAAPVDVLFALVDRRDYSLDLAISGEAYCFLQRSDKDALEIFSSTHLETRNEPLTSRCALSSKDRLILCTKGLIQEMQPESKDRMVGAIRSAPKKGVHDLRNEILMQRELLTKKSQPDSDVTLVVIEVKDRVIKLAKS